ncbi:MAG: hypothetical protein HYZ75_04790 [Elusimicrobia bacterium]|nr:hypothetical protein [Elusimicrobiota bacterium]
MRRRRALMAVLAVLIPVSLAMSPLGLRGLISESALAALRSWDAFHLSLEPHLEHTRAPKRVDPRPLAEQAAAMEDDLDAVFTTFDGKLFLIDTPPVQVGDVCLWQGVFAAEAALRASLTGSNPDAVRAAKALEGLGMLTSRGRPIARSFYPATLRTENPGLWAGRDRHYQWKEDASIDSVIGWVFGVLMVRELLPALRPEADRLIVGFSAALRGGGYRLRNSDGSLTRFNRVGGAWINAPAGVLVTLAALQTAARADPRGPWATEHARFIREGQDRWGAYGSVPMLWRNKTTNHNIAFLALSAALLAEDAPARKTVYARGLVRLSRLMEKSGNSFWTYLAVWSLERKGFADPLKDREVALWLARRRAHMGRARVAMLEWDYPRNKVRREVVNSADPALAMGRWPFSGLKALRQPLPVWQRPPADFLWQRSAYSMDDWEGHPESEGKRFSPLDFLIAYRLGQAIGALDGSE